MASRRRRRAHLSRERLTADEGGRDAATQRRGGRGGGPAGDRDSTALQKHCDGFRLGGVERVVGVWCFVLFEVVTTRQFGWVQIDV